MRRRDRYGWWFREESLVAHKLGEVVEATGFKPRHPIELREQQAKMNANLWPSEKFLKKACIKAGLREFLQNEPVLNRFWGDFVFRQEMVVLEADGSIHESDKQKQRDARRDELMLKCGYLVFRVKYPFDDDELRRALIAVKEALKQRQWLYEKTVSPWVVLRVEKFKRKKKKPDPAVCAKPFNSSDATTKQIQREKTAEAYAQLRARQKKFEESLAERKRVKMRETREAVVERRIKNK